MEIHPPQLIELLSRLQIVPPTTEVLARVDSPEIGGTWLLEESTSINFAIQQRQSNSIASTSNFKLEAPVRLLNSRMEPTTIYAGSEIATLASRMEVANSECRNSSNNPFSEIQRDSRSSGWFIRSSRVEAETSLTHDEKERFFDLVCSFEDVFAVSNSDLGQTGTLKHKIDTGDSSMTNSTGRASLTSTSKSVIPDVKKLLGEMMDNNIVDQINQSLGFSDRSRKV